jgi:hypothetical protein
MRKHTQPTRRGGGSFINSFRHAIGSNPNVARNPRTKIWSRKGSVKISTYIKIVRIYGKEDIMFHLIPFRYVGI